MTIVLAEAAKNIKSAAENKFTQQDACDTQLLKFTL